VAQLSIDRMSIEAPPGMTPEQGERLALLIVDGLGGVRWPGTTPGDTAKVKATVTAGTKEMSLKQMAQAIVEEIVRRIA
jgi:hypothetical protein